MSNHKKRRNSQTNMKSLIITLSLLCVVGLVIGYAVLTEQLTINNTVSYDAMKWNVGFTEVEDFSETYQMLLKEIGTTALDGYEFIAINPEISDNKKGISFPYNPGGNTKPKIISALATITNDSTFDIKLTDMGFLNPTEELEDFFYTHIERIMIFWYTSSTEMVELKIGDTIPARESKKILIIVVYKELTEDILPEEDITIESSFYFDWVEADSEEE